MTKNLSAQLQLIREVEVRKEQLERSRATIIAEKEKAIEGAEPNDSKAFQKVGALGSQENYLTALIDKASQEVTARSVAAFNEANYTRLRVGRAIKAKRHAMLERLDRALTPFWPDAADRRRAIAKLPQSPEAHRLGRRSGALLEFSFVGRGIGELEYARQVLAMCDRAIEECGI